MTMTTKEVTKIPIDPGDSGGSQWSPPSVDYGGMGIDPNLKEGETMSFWNVLGNVTKESVNRWGDFGLKSVNSWIDSGYKESKFGGMTGALSADREWAKKAQSFYDKNYQAIFKGGPQGRDAHDNQTWTNARNSMQNLQSQISMINKNISGYDAAIKTWGQIYKDRGIASKEHESNLKNAKNAGERQRLKQEHALRTMQAASAGALAQQQAAMASMKAAQDKQRREIHRAEKKAKHKEKLLVNYGHIRGSSGNPNSDLMMKKSLGINRFKVTPNMGLGMGDDKKRSGLGF